MNDLGPTYVQPFGDLVSTHNVIRFDAFGHTKNVQSLATRKWNTFVVARVNEYERIQK